MKGNKVLCTCLKRTKVLFTCYEMKNSKVRGTYLVSGLEWMWGLEWWPWMLDSKEGSQAVLGVLDSKEKRSKRGASVIRRRLKWLSFII